MLARLLGIVQGKGVLIFSIIVISLEIIFYLTIKKFRYLKSNNSLIISIWGIGLIGIILAYVLKEDEKHWNLREDYENTYYWLLGIGCFLFIIGCSVLIKKFLDKSNSNQFD